MKKEKDPEKTSKFLKCINCLSEFKNLDLSSAKEQELYLCQNCYSNFAFICCFHCSNPIFYKDKINIDQIPIKCPYKTCNKSFSISICPKCSIRVYYSCRFPIKCPNEKCENFFAKIQCPYPKCHSIITKEAKKEDLIPPYQEGNLIECINHNPHSFFQKLTCVKCCKFLLWIYPNILIKGQKIFCPYEDCKAVFNKINCPFCFKLNIFSKGTFQYNTRYKCVYCSNIFNFIFCPYCYITFNIFEGKYIEGMPIKCPNCNNKPFQAVNCFQCKQINFWIKNPYFYGQKFNCANQRCSKFFCKAPCPYCLKLNVFPNGDFSYGCNYTCVNNQCLQTFSVFLCPNCGKFQCEKDIGFEGRNILCHNCQMNYINITCPHCSNLIGGKKITLKYGQSVLCPYQNCQKLFNCFYCFQCKSLFYDKNNTYYEGEILKCPKCKMEYINYQCANCKFCNSIKITEDNRKIMSDKVKNYDVLTCQNCGNKFYPSKIMNIFSDGVEFHFYKGEFIAFYQPIKDPYQLKVNENFIKNYRNYAKIYTREGEGEREGDEKEEETFQIESNVIEINDKIIDGNWEKMECVICCAKASEAVFIPCGHRCACIGCGETIMKTTRKCPICQLEATFLLPKIYDC